jgi:hypothetical protein
MVPKIRETTNSTRKMKKRILAMPVAAAAIPENPRTPAIIAMMKKTSAQLNIWLLLFQPVSAFPAVKSE